MFAVLLVLAYGPLDWSFPVWVWGLSLIAPVLATLLVSLNAFLVALIKK